jgi:hypothetical protein
MIGPESVITLGKEGGNITHTASSSASDDASAGGLLHDDVCECETCRERKSARAIVGSVIYTQWTLGMNANLNRDPPDWLKDEKKSWIRKAEIDGYDETGSKYQLVYACQHKLYRTVPEVQDLVRLHGMMLKTAVPNIQRLKQFADAEWDTFQKRRAEIPHVQGTPQLVFTINPVFTTCILHLILFPLSHTFIFT